jgi:hypothetical protein
MDLVENKALNLIFQIAIALGLGGIIMYLIQEIIYGMINPAYTVFVVIADFIGIFALIALIIWMFIPNNKTLILNITYILGAAYVLIFSFAHFFATLYYDYAIFPLTGNFLDNFITTGSSFFGLLLLFLVTIGVIVVFALRFTNKEEINLYEKFTILVWIILVAIYDFTNSYLIRQRLTFNKLLFTRFGITFLPGILEFILLLFAAILIILKLFTKADKEIIKVLMFVLLDIVFFAYTITTVNYVGFDFTVGKLAPSIIANHFFIIATVAVLICTFLLMMNRYKVKKTVTTTK